MFKKAIIFLIFQMKNIYRVYGVLELTGQTSSVELIFFLMMKDLFKTQIIKHMKHSLLIRFVHGYYDVICPIFTL